MPHPTPLKRVSCSQCHRIETEIYLQSDHGKAVAHGMSEAASCRSCHGEPHHLLNSRDPASPVNRLNIPATCAACHEDRAKMQKYHLAQEAPVSSYLASVHGKALLERGVVAAAVCTDCHGSHDLHKATNTDSKPYWQQIPQTCGKCHPGVSAQVAQGQIHSGTRPGLEHRASSLVRRIYLWLIMLTIGGMLLHNILDFRRKLLERYRLMRAAGRSERMGLNERVQHLLLLAAFVTLAYTGFALKFPQAWWASPFVGRVDWRSLGHRTAAVIFCLLAVYHLWFMTCTRRGRRELRALWPRRVDCVQPFQMLAYYLGRRKERPAVARYSYIEKAEYWALVWGSIVMALTGALMTWEGWTLRLFPKWLFDAVTAIHYYEAILACLAILVWHMYWVMFDPDEYPMKWTWVTGRSSPSDQRHRHDDVPEDR